MNTIDHARTVKNRFSAKARTYAESAHIQETIAGRLSTLLPADRPLSPVLEVGCGTGMLTRRLLRKWPGVEIHAVDIAPGMIRCAQRLLADAGSVRWIIADAAHFCAPTTYQLIASNCSLHWLHPFPDGFRNLAALLSPGGCFAAAMMLDGTLAELRASRLRAAPRKPPAGRLPTFEEVNDALHENGLAVTHASQETTKSRFLSARDVLAMVHEQGLTGGHVSRSGSALTRGELNGLAREYESNFQTADGYVEASYHTGFFIARNADLAT